MYQKFKKKNNCSLTWNLFIELNEIMHVSFKTLSSKTICKFKYVLPHV